MKNDNKILWVIVGIAVGLVIAMAGMLGYNKYVDKKNFDGTIEMSAGGYKDRYKENDIAEINFSYENSKKIDFIYLELSYGNGLELIEVINDHTEEFVYSKVEQKGNKSYFYFDEPNVLGALGNYKFKIKNIDGDLTIKINNGYVRYTDKTYSKIKNTPITLNSNNGGNLYICSRNKNYYSSYLKNYYYSFNDESNNYQDCKKSDITVEKGYSIIKKIETEKIVVLEKDNKIVFFDYQKNKIVHEFTLPNHNYYIDDLYINEDTGFTYGFTIYYYEKNDPTFEWYRVFYDLDTFDSFKMEPVMTVPSLNSNVILTDGNRLVKIHDYINYEEKFGLYDLKENKIIFENKYDYVYPIHFEVEGYSNEDVYYAAKDAEGNNSLVYFIKSKQKIAIPSNEFWVLNDNYVAYLENNKIYITSINNINNKSQSLIVIEKTDGWINYINFVEFEGDAPFDETSTVNNIYDRATNYIAMDTEEGIKYYNVEDGKLLFETKYTYDE